MSTQLISPSFSRTGYCSAQDLRRSLAPRLRFWKDVRGFDGGRPCCDIVLTHRLSGDRLAVVMADVARRGREHADAAYHLATQIAGLLRVDLGGDVTPVDVANIIQTPVLVSAALSRKTAIIVVAALAVVSCGIRPQSATTRLSPPPTQHHGIFATSRANEVHQLGLTVDVAPDLRAPAGITPIQVTIHDPSRSLVRDAIVYVVLDSKTARTPKMIVVASNREDGTYIAELPLVYDSAWTFSVKAFSKGRSGIVTVVEDTN